MIGKILIVDDEDMIRWSLCSDLANAGYKTVGAATVAEAVEALENECPDAVLTDLRLGSASGIDVLKATRRERPGIPVVLMTAFADFASAVEALREGATDYISKPLQLAGLKITLQRVLENATMRSRLANAQEKRRDRYSLDTIVCASPPMAETLALARKIAACPHGTVLLLGESGCGKDRLARGIHFASARAAQPLMEISCTAIPEALLESELFGYEKGAFTGALQQKHGLVELADGGTLFLNEIGHMPLGLQGKILRFLEDRTFKRVGGRDDITVNVRIVAATNENLEEAVIERRFRQDLYYRLNVLTLRLQPLRKRREDIRPLIDRLLDRLSRELNRPRLVLRPPVLDAMTRYDWPGNVRELRNVLERMLILGEAEFQPPGAFPTQTGETGSPVRLPASGLRIDEVERSLVKQALELSYGNQQKAAKLLGLKKDALRRRMEKFDLKACVFAVLACGLVSAAQAGWFGSAKADAKDPFLEAYAVRAKELREAAGAHQPVKEGVCSKCHASPLDPAKLVQEPKPLCLSCHEARVRDLKKASVHPPFAEGDCSMCHQAHGSAKPALLISEVNELCAGCHALSDDAPKKAHFGITNFSGSCTACHSPHGSTNPKLLGDSKLHVPFGSGSCEMCHEPADKEGKAVLKAVPDGTCFVCHSDFRKKGELPVVHPPFAGGGCTDCHSPHRSERAFLMAKPTPAVCLSCHDEGLRDNHPVARHPTSKVVREDPRRKGRPFDCASCHEPHAGKLEKLLREDPMILCQECHAK